MISGPRSKINDFGPSTSLKTLIFIFRLSLLCFFYIFFYIFLYFLIFSLGVVQFWTQKYKHSQAKYKKNIKSSTTLKQNIKIAFGQGSEGPESMILGPREMDQELSKPISY